MKQEAGHGAKQYQAARDLTINNYGEQSTTYSVQYKKLADEFEKELRSGDTDLKTFIAKIKHYTSKIDDFIGLKEKLKEAGYEADYKWALRCKEMYSQMLTENDLSLASQKIHAFLLARICTLFNLHIRGAIDDGTPKEDVRELIIQKIIFPVQNMIGENNVLGLLDDDIMSMIYFLTGNCHIRWKSNDNLPPTL